MKKKFLVLSVALLLLLSVVATPQEASAGTNVFVPTIAKKAKKVKVKKIAHYKTPKSMYVGSSHSVKVTFNPKKPTNKKFTVTSSNKKVIKVSGTKIKALKAGKATISVKSKDGGKTHKVTITVKNKPIAVKSIKHSKTPTTMNVGAKHSIKVSFSPAKPTSTSYSVASSSSKILKVSGKTIQALKPGKAIITVKSGNGKSHKLTVTVKQPVTSIKHSKTPSSMTVGDTHLVKASISPSNATDKTFKVSSSNSKVVTVSGEKLIAKEPGTATIKVMTRDGSKSSSKTVTVFKAGTVRVATVALNNVPTTMKSKAYNYRTKKVAYTQASISSTVTPSNATTKTVSYTSSNTNVISISGNAIKAVNPGKAVITVTTKDGSKKASKTVTVTNRYPNAGGDVTLEPSKRANWSDGKDSQKQYDWYGNIFTPDESVAVNYYGDVQTVTKKIYVPDANGDKDLNTTTAYWTGLVAKSDVLNTSENQEALIIESGYLGFDSGLVDWGDVTYDIERTYIDGIAYPSYDKQASPLRVIWVGSVESATVKHVAFTSYAEAEAWAQVNIGNNLGYKVYGTGNYRGENQKFLVAFYANYNSDVNKFISQGSTYKTETSEELRYISASKDETANALNAFVNDPRLYMLSKSTGELVHNIRQGQTTVWKDASGNFTIYEARGNDITFNTYKNNRNIDTELAELGHTRVLDSNDWLQWDEEAHLFERDKGLPNASDFANREDYI
jgi:uncharacterized protein YjdB